MAGKGVCSPQEFHFGRAVTARFHWGSLVSCRVRYGDSPGTAVEVEPRVIRLEATEDCKPALNKGDQRYWFAYWISTPDTRRKSGGGLAFGGGGSVLSEGDLLDLLRKARGEKDFFSPSFWKELASIGL